MSAGRRKRPTMTPPANRNAPLIVEELNGEYAMSVTHPPVPVVPEGEPTDARTVYPLCRWRKSATTMTLETTTTSMTSTKTSMTTSKRNSRTIMPSRTTTSSSTMTLTKEDDLGDAAFDGEPDEFGDTEEDASKPASDDEDKGKAAEDKD